MSKEKFNHKEAFCHMRYRCEICGEEIMIWNSRDGVTPFGVSCINKLCSGSMTHINWNQDKFDKDYLPQGGDYVFIDLPKQLFDLYIKMRIRKYWDNETCPMSKYFKSKDEAFKKLSKTSKTGEPDLQKL